MVQLQEKRKAKVTGKVSAKKRVKPSIKEDILEQEEEKVESEQKSKAKVTGKVRAKKKVKPTLEKEIRQEEDKEIESEERPKAKVTGKARTKKKVKPTLKEEIQEEKMESEAMAIKMDVDDKNKDGDGDAEETEEAKNTEKSRKRIRDDAEEVDGKKSKTEARSSKIIYVTGVTEDMSHEELSKYFEDAEAVRMVKGKKTGKNRNFAYIEFNDEESAKKCYKSSKEGIKSEDGSTTFYVNFAKERRTEGAGDHLVTMRLTNLPKDIDQGKLVSFLKENEIQCKDWRGSFNQCKVFVDVQARDREKAAGLDQVQWNENVISVKEVRRLANRAKAPEGRKGENQKLLYVKNIPFDTTEDSVMGVFENATAVKLLSHRNSELCCGSAFVEFKDTAAMEKAMEMKDKFELNGRQLALDYANSCSMTAAEAGDGEGAGNRRRSKGKFRGRGRGSGFRGR